MRACESDQEDMVNKSIVVALALVLLLTLQPSAFANSGLQTNAKGGPPPVTTEKGKPPTPADKGKPPKDEKPSEPERVGHRSTANGNLWFNTPTASHNPAHAWFSLHDLSPLSGEDKGWLRYTDRAGAYRVEVNTVTVSAGDATFSGSVTESNLPGVAVGATLSYRVHDGGKPGREGDWISIAGSAGMPATRGNVIVHYRPQ
jgi:hypothetical protein